VDLAPADKCYINVDDFSGPADLAAYLNRLHRDHRAYNEYLAWKQQGLRQRFLDLVEPLQGVGDALSEELTLDEDKVTSVSLGEHEIPPCKTSRPCTR